MSYSIINKLKLYISIKNYKISLLFLIIFLNKYLKNISFLLKISKYLKSIPNSNFLSKTAKDPRNMETIWQIKRFLRF